MPVMRKGPHPLSVHIGMAASEMARQECSGGLADYETAFSKMLIGIQRYQTSDIQINRPILVNEIALGECTLRGLATQSDDNNDRPVILLMPSMINRYHIFNLTADRSMMSYYAGKGYRPLVLDWGKPTNDLGLSNFDSLFSDRVFPLLEYINEKYNRMPHIVGYCMGGLLSVAVSVLAPQKVASLSLIASPWDFSAGPSALRERIDFWRSSAQQSLATKNYLDQDCLQTLFASLDPLLTRDKFIKFSDMPRGGDDERRFVAIEDWLNDGVDLPADIANECINNWYQNNTTFKGNWIVCGKNIRLSGVRCPSLIVASDKDRLVNYESAACMVDGILKSTLHNPKCGHIGMIAGRRAVKDVWKPIFEFINSCNS